MAGGEPLGRLSLRVLIRGDRIAGVSDDRWSFDAGPLAVLELLRIEWSI